MCTPNNRRSALAAVLLATAATAPVAAQVRFFPDVRSFEYPIGTAAASGIVGRLVNTSRGETAYGNEREADVSVGENFPVLGFGSGPAPFFLGMTLRVGARFSLDDPRSALISNEWVAGVHGVMDRGPWRIAAELYHESSHLGDEYAERFQRRRVDWTREVATLWVRRALGSFSASASGSYTLIDALPLSRGAVGAGVDYRGRLGRLGGSVVTPVAGVFAEALGYADWDVTTTARAGLEVGGDRGRMGVSMVFLDGQSTMRQFYDRRSRYVGVELRFELGR